MAVHPLFQSDPLARLWFLRAAQAADLVNQEEYCKPLRALIGVDDASDRRSDNEKSSAKKVKPQMGKLLRRAIAAQSKQPPRRGLFHDNIARLARLLRLSSVEADVFAFAARVGGPVFDELAEYVARAPARRCRRATSRVTSKTSPCIARFVITARPSRPPSHVEAR